MKEFTIFIIFGSLILLLVEFIGGDYKEYNFNREVDAVYWHNHNRYSIAYVTDKGILKHKRIPINPIVYTDLELNEKPWYKCNYNKSKAWGLDDAFNNYCELHINSVNDLNTAEYNCGKDCKRTANRIN